MSTFTDDFNRANGPPGNGWSQVGAFVTISGQRITCTLNRMLYRKPWDHAQTSRARIVADSTLGQAHYPKVVARYDPTANVGIGGAYIVGSTNNQALIQRITSTGAYTLASTTFGTPSAGPHTLELVEDDGEYKLYVDGVLRVTHTDNTWSAYEYVGISPTDMYAFADDFYADDVGVAPTLDVAPDPVEQIGPDPTLTLTGTDTAWDPNTNTPTFTVDKGSVISQEVTSATSATMNYALPHVQDTLTVTDPSTGATAQVALDSTLGLDLTVDLSPVLDILGTPAVGHTVTGDQTALLAETVMPDPPPTVTDIIDWFVAGFLAATVPEALLDKLDALYGKLPPEQQILSLETLAQTELAWINRNLGLLTDDVAAIAGEEELSLRAVINAIAGVPNYTTKEVYDLIQTLTSNGFWDLAGIKAQIDLVRGDPATNLSTILTAIQNIPPLEVETITDYLDWLTGTQTYNLAPIDTGVTALLNNLSTHDGNMDGAWSALTAAGTLDLQAILDAIATHDTDIKALLDALGTTLDDLDTYVRTTLADLHNDVANVHADLQVVNTQVEALYNWWYAYQRDTIPWLTTHITNIENAIAALPRPNPVWPGQANVTLGNAVALSTDLRITGSIDGVIVQLESQPHKLATFPMGDHSYSYRLGFITFEADAGWLEPWQYLGFDSALYVPRQMRRAAAVRIRYLGDAEGTAQPWTNV